jgi:arsenite transporter
MNRRDGYAPVIKKEWMNMSPDSNATVNDRKMTNVFRALPDALGFALHHRRHPAGKVAPGFARHLDGMAIYVKGAPVVSIPIAVCLFFMMYPIMVKIDFGTVIKAGKSGKPVFLTLFVNWCIKPFTMYGIALFFLGTLFLGFIGPEATDYVKMPFGLDLPVGATHGAGTVCWWTGSK